LQEKNVITATKFLDARQLALTKHFLTAADSKNHVFDGDVPEAEQVIYLFMLDYPPAHELFAYRHIVKRESLMVRD